MGPTACPLHSQMQNNFRSALCCHLLIMPCCFETFVCNSKSISSCKSNHTQSLVFVKYFNDYADRCWDNVKYFKLSVVGFCLKLRNSPLLKLQCGYLTSYLRLEQIKYLIKGSVQNFLWDLETYFNKMKTLPL